MTESPSEAKPPLIEVESLIKKPKRLKVMIFGAERYGLALHEEIQDPNFHAFFRPYDTPDRFSDFDGVVVFQRLFERFERKSSWAGSYMTHDCDSLQLDRRHMEAQLLVKNGGFLCFILHLPFSDRIFNDGSTIDATYTDLSKKYLNFRDFYRDDFSGRNIHVCCIKDEFRRFFQLYGAAQSSFTNHALSWKRLATVGNATVSMILFERIFFIPCLLPDAGPERTEEFYRLLLDGVDSTIKRIPLELPPWANEFQLPGEPDLLRETECLRNRIGEISTSLSLFLAFKRVLTGDSDYLVADVVNLLRRGLGLDIVQKDVLREDFFIKAPEISVFCEVKGSTRDVKRDHINQTDSHRERAGLDSKTPAILIVNTRNKNSRSLGEKDQPPASEQIKHAVTMNILIIRTFDLLHLLSLLMSGQIQKSEMIRILTSEAGWLRCSATEAKVLGE